MSEYIISTNYIELKNNNKIIVIGQPISNEIKIQNLIFKGKNNILIIDSNAVFFSTNIVFNGSNSTAFINSTSNNRMNLNLSLYNNSTYYQGKNNYFNGRFNCIVSESKNVIIGDNGIFSFNIWVRTSDAHLIYNLEDKKRLNHAKDVILGSHVWIGQNVTILKGAFIGSGSVIGLNSVVSKKINSNTLNLGNHIKELKENIFWDNTSTHDFLETDIEIYNYYKDNSSEIEYDFSTIPDTTNQWMDLSKKLSASTSEEKYSILKQLDILPFTIKKSKKKRRFRFF
ncbi:hypothetical protein P7H60_07690 [Vagococcus carniphilus]|uniref:hypothetical protein n=1 Tax=Vagococcus carniphilus TaxID=218144 RepID=UPI002891F8E9|nr:hypothetical protein [Vagococcus carniphilus]MDT2849044.1 hypothetical protein [Vagococcus carniphilus]MDT2864360.1 hypothetical protein [Vagococcus carniphilus]